MAVRGRIGLRMCTFPAACIGDRKGTMRYLKSLAALALAAFAVMSLAAPANAQPARDLGFSYIYNKPENAIGIGVIYKWEGSPNYHAILPAGKRTDSYLGWQVAQGFYIGPGYCADPYYYANGRWHWYGVTVSNGKFRLATDIPGESWARNEVRDLRRC
ncbi:hypothetical protein [Nonomuraea sp. NPDC048826]|uniref:hypothetical protein n=1 Tax=Nonomuraea sp. NPDC048826 TaxID=3364347 RepID=UPI0037104CD8